MNYYNLSFESLKSYLYMLAIAACVAVVASASSITAYNASAASNDLNSLIKNITTEVNTQLTSVQGAIKSIQSINSLTGVDSAKSDTTKGLNDILSSLMSYQSQIPGLKTISDANSLAQKLKDQFTAFYTTTSKATTLKDADSQQGAQGKLIDLTKQVQSALDAGGAANIDVKAPQEQLKNIDKLIQSIGAILTSIVALITALATGNFAQAATIFQTIIGQLGQNLSSITSAQSGMQGLLSSLPSQLLNNIQIGNIGGGTDK